MAILRVIEVTARERKALITGAAIIAIAVGFLRVIPFATRRFQTQLADLRARTGLLAHARTEVEAAGQLRDSASMLSQRLVQLGPALLLGSTATEAVSDLSGRLNLIVTRSPARAVRLDPVSDTITAGRLHRVSLHATLETDVRGLKTFLSAIDATDPVVTVTSIQVEAPEPASTDRVAEVLKVDVTISGWYLEHSARPQQSDSDTSHNK